MRKIVGIVFICLMLVLTTISPSTIAKTESGPELEVGLYTSISFGLNYDGLQIYVKNIGLERLLNDRYKMEVVLKFKIQQPLYNPLKVEGVKKEWCH